MTEHGFTLPPLLDELLSKGIWPSNYQAVNAQNFKPLVPLERVRRFAPEEERICFSSPPFLTIADHMARASPDLLEEYWKKLVRCDQVVPEKALILGDFGLGSDAPIILDYSRSSFDPPVLRLRYAGNHTDWVEGARNFEEFAVMLGLVGETV